MKAHVFDLGGPERAARNIASFVWFQNFMTVDLKRLSGLIGLAVYGADPIAVASDPIA